jgi:hypothetical protein
MQQQQEPSHSADSSASHTSGSHSSSSATANAQTPESRKAALENLRKKMLTIEQDVHQLVKTVDPNSMNIVFRIVLDKLRNRMVQGSSGRPVHVPSLDGMDSSITPKHREVSNAVADKVKVSAVS